MRRIENDHPERVILEWQMTEVRNDIRPHFQDTPVNKRPLHFPIIAEHDILVLLVEVEHPGTTAHVKNWFICFHPMRKWEAGPTAS